MVPEQQVPRLDCEERSQHAPPAATQPLATQPSGVQVVPAQQLPGV